MSSRGETADEDDAATADTAGGRLKVSATMFAEPATCLTSVVNSEMKLKCLVCLGDFSVEELKAPQSGL